MTTPAAGGAADAAGGQAGQGGSVQPSGANGAAGQGGSTAGQQGQAAGGKGAADDSGLYAKYLENIPSQLHSTVIAAFKDFDGSVTKQQQGVRSEYAPWQPLIDSGADPQQLQAAGEFLQALQEDPEGLIRQLAGELGMDFGDGQQQPATPGQGGMDEGQQQAAPGLTQGSEIPPWFTDFQQQQEQTNQLVQLLSQAYVSQHEEAETTQQVDQLEEALMGAAQGAGVDLQGDPHAQNFVLAQLAGIDDSVPVDQAVGQAIQAWTDMVAGVRGSAQSQAMPTMLPAGGGLPTSQVDPATLSTADRRKLVAQNVMQRRAQGGG